MKPLLHLFLTGIFISCSLAVLAQQDYKYSTVKITIAKDKIVRLQESGIDLDHGHYDDAGKTFTTDLSEVDVEKLSHLSYPYEILVADTKADFLKRNKPEEFFKYANDPVKSTNRFVYDAPSSLVENNFTTPAAFTSGSMGGYYTLTELMAKLTAMKTNYPTLARMDTIGYTWESRPIVAVKISSNVNVDAGKPEALFTGLHHAREPNGMMNLVFFMQYLLENYATNPLVQELVDNRALYFIPCVNPDGYQYNCTTNPSGGGMHRKNRRVNANTTNMGVDLNRNYGFGFGYPNSGSSTTVTADNYRGPGSVGFTEPETQAMRDYVVSRNFKFAINYHCYGEYWINSYCVPTGTLTALDSKIIEMSGYLMTRNNFYLVGTPIQTVGYNANGSSDDWLMAGTPAHNKVYCFSPEIGSNADNFWPVSSRIIPLAKEMAFANFQAAYIAGSYDKVEDASSIAVNSASGNFAFTLRRLGLTDAPVTVSIVPLQNIQSVGSPVVISSIANPLDTLNRTISYTLSPGIQMGQRIRFLWKVETGGISLVDTIDKLYNPTLVKSDDMEGVIGTNWTATGTWGFGTASPFAGTKSLVSNTATNYSNNANNTATLKNVLDLSGSNSAFLSFWVRYRTETGQDKLRVQAASNGNGGGASWVSLPTSFSIAETGGTIGGTPALTGIQDYWVREFVDLSSYTGGNNVGLRFLFQSDAANVNNGFFIDGLEIYKSNSISLPVKFESIKAIPGASNVTILWQAQTNEQHDHFEIERSTDGSTFSVIGKVYGSGYDFSYVDNDPFPGTNHYRVKGVDKDDKYDYTPVVSVRFGQDTRFRIYPNPVLQQLNISVTTVAPAKYDFTIISSTGQVVRKVSKNIPLGVQSISIPVSDLPSGSYLVQVSNKQEIITSKAFVKAAN